MKKTCYERGHRYSSFWPFCPICFVRKFWWLIIPLILVCIVTSGVAATRPYINCTDPYLGCQTITPTPTLSPTHTPTPMPPSPTSSPTPTMTPTPKEFNWIQKNPDDTKGAGIYPSLAFDSYGQSVIAYLHDSGDRLVIAGEVGRSWDFFETDVMNGSRPGFYPAIVVDSKGNFHVVHYFLGEGMIAYMQGGENRQKWNDISVVAKNITIRDMSRALTLAIGSNDKLYLAFMDTENQMVNLASLSYQTWNVREVGWGDSSTGSVALAVDDTNQHLAFYNGDGLQYIHIKNGAIEDEQIIDGGRSIGLSPSMAIDKKGNMAIAYYAGNEIRLAIKTNARWVTYRVGDAIPLKDDSRRTTSIAFSPDGMLHLCYFDAGKKSGRLMYVMVNRSGKIFIHQEVDYGGVGMLNSLAIDHQGMPAIAYFDQTGEHLRFAYVDSGK